MPHYRFEALTFAGKTERGSVEGDSLRTVRQGLIARQLVPIRIELESEWAKNLYWQRFFSDNRALSRSELAVFSKQLALLVRSSVSIEEALRVLGDETAKPHVKKVLQTVSDELRSGLPLSRAIAIHPDSFDDLYQGVVAAAEQSGKMGQVLTQLAEFLEKRQALKQKALGALAYPAMLTAVSFMVIMFLMTYVVPQIARVFQSSKQTLPFLTKAILAISGFISSWGLVLLLLVAAIFFLGGRALKQEENRIKFDRFCLNLPILGPLILSFETARFANTMAMLVMASVPILTSLRSARYTLMNHVLRKAIESTELRLREGATLAQALGSQAVFSPLLIHLIRAGEASGKLGEMLKYGAENAELEAEQKTKLFTGILEPALILLMGLLVLVIVMAVMQPILELNSGVH